MPATHTHERARAGGAGGRSPRRRLRALLASWRLALRLGWRDIRAHRARSALIVTAVGVPVFILVGAITFGMTTDIDRVESLPGLLGSADARISAVTDSRVQQDRTGREWRQMCPDPKGMSSTSSGDGWTPSATVVECGSHLVPAEPLPGVAPGERRSLPDTADALSRLTGARVLPVRFHRAEVLAPGRRSAPRPVLEVDGRDPMTRGMVELVSGRWPTRPDEVLLTRAALGDGLAGRPSVTLTGPGTSTGTTHTVVGTVRVAPTSDLPAYAVRLPDEDPTDMQFLLSGGPPMTGERVGELNRHGLVVHARGLVTGQVDPGGLRENLWVDGPAPSRDEAIAPSLAIVAVILFLEGVLVAGPAFAVVAARRRRDLALLAANGARPGDLRRVLLGQAVLLGVLAAVVGALSGIGLVAMAAVSLPVLWPSMIEFGPLDVDPVWPVVIAAGAVVAAVVAALLPSRGLGGLALRGALEADGPPPPISRRRLPLALGFVVLGSAGFGYAAAIAAGVVSFEDDALLFAGVVIVSGLSLVGGAVSLIPSLLVGLGRLSSRWPLSVRLALRDAARRRRRTSATVAAALGGAMLLSGLGVLSFSFSRAAAEEHTPVAPHGHGFVALAGQDDTPLRARITDADPTVRITTLHHPRLVGDEQNGSTWAVTRDGCLPRVERDGGPCHVAALPTGPRWVVVASVEDATRVYGLDPVRQDALRRGHVLVTEGAADLVTAGAVTLTRVDLGAGAAVGDPSRVTATTMPTPPFALAGSRDGVLMTPGTARRHGVETAPAALILSSDEGPLTDRQIRALEPLREAENGYGGLLVETGYGDPVLAVWIIAAVAVGLVITVSTVTATVLGMNEARADIAALTAVGAPPQLTREMAAVQSGVLAGLGTVLGYLVGIVPAVAAITATSLPAAVEELDPGEVLSALGAILVVPWAPLAAALALVVGLSGAIAAAVTRSDASLSRRPT